MSKKSIKKNYLYNLCYQILVVITPLITTPYLSRVLGADGIGTVSYAESIVAYFVVFANLGITIFGQREISYVQDDIKRRSQLFWETKLLSLITSLASLCVFLVYVIAKSKTSLYFVLAFNILSVTADITWLFQGLEEFGKIVFRNFVIKLLNVAYIFVFIRNKNDYLLYALGIGLFLFLGNVSLWVYLPKYIEKIDLSKIRPFRNLGTVLTLFLPTVAIQIYAVLDKTMIGLITGSAFENGYYEQAMKISKILLTIVTSLGAVMIPRIGYYYEKKDYKKVEEYMYQSYRFVWFMGVPLCFGLIGVSSNFVPWFYGTGFDKVVPLLSILGFLIISIGISNITGLQYLVPTKRQKYLTISVCIGAATNLILNLVLIKKYQAIGAAIASVIAESSVAISQLVLIQKEISIKKVVKSGIVYFLCGGVMLFAVKILSSVLSPSIINTVILVFCGITVYSLMLILFRDYFFINNSKIVFKKITMTIRPKGD